MDDMEPNRKGRRFQFRLRTLLLATMWFALILAVCVQYQHAATRRREAIETLRAAGRLPPVRIVGGGPTASAATTSPRRAPPRRAPAAARTTRDR